MLTQLTPDWKCLKMGRV
ncbi:hypothetical protein CIB84_017095 [Bambusicola thoracicus]|uniref:Uncharacterized protein n=1 Tax=Bambusicola thoracicus TaxID=9083 RepID=A0A2P4S4W8_BAMTH|nr:hypothetical protein CIB84_017095 [Bambusicola thoracicus]